MNESNSWPLAGLALATVALSANAEYQYAKESIEDAHDERRKRNDDSLTRKALIEAGLVKPKAKKE